RCGYAGEVVVCDNGSTDGSAEEAARAGARVVTQSIRGYGAACLRGLEEARGSILVIADGDGTYDLSVLHRFVEPLRAGYDIVLGTRRNGEIERGAMKRVHRHMLEPVQTWLSRRFLHFHVSDVRCGLRSITREARGRLDLGATGMEFASEMLLESARAELKAVEVPVRFQPRPEGVQRRSVGDGWRVARQLLLLSPTRLFLLPGILLLVGGLALEIALLPGPIYIARSEEHTSELQSPTRRSSDLIRTRGTEGCRSAGAIPAAAGGRPATERRRRLAGRAAASAAQSDPALSAARNPSACRGTRARDRAAARTDIYREIGRAHV